ncbi:MAG: integrin alpha, partial [Candidatus Midichloria sp.]|nr:integrin alpha [Candidatus Midichloria sp.]
MNGDGKNDIIIGTPYADKGTGQAYVIYGQSNSPLSLPTSLNGVNGFIIKPQFDVRSKPASLFFHELEFIGFED